MAEVGHSALRSLWLSASVPLTSSGCEPEVSCPLVMFSGHLCHLIQVTKSVTRFSRSLVSPLQRVCPGPSTFGWTHLLSDLLPHQVGELCGVGAAWSGRHQCPRTWHPQVSGEHRACGGHRPVHPLCGHGPGPSRASKHHAGSRAAGTWARPPGARCPGNHVRGTAQRPLELSPL